MLGFITSRFATHTYYSEPKVKTENKSKTHHESVIHKMMQHLKTAVSGGKEKLSNLLKDIKSRKEENVNKDIKANNDGKVKKEIKTTDPVAPGLTQPSDKTMDFAYGNFALKDIKKHQTLFSAQIETGEFTLDVCRGLMTSIESVIKGMKHDETLSGDLDKLNQLRNEKNITINGEVTKFTDLGDKITAGREGGKEAGTEVTDPQSLQNVKNTMTQIMDIINSLKPFA